MKKCESKEDVFEALLKEYANDEKTLTNWCDITEKEISDEIRMWQDRYAKAKSSIEGQTEGHCVGNILRNDKLSAGGCPHLVLMLSSDKESGWTEEVVWRCAHIQICNDFLLGAQIVLFTEKELGQMEWVGRLSDALKYPIEGQEE